MQLDHVNDFFFFLMKKTLACIAFSLSIVCVFHCANLK